LTREEIVQIMLDAWDQLDPSLGANAWEHVKLMPGFGRVLGTPVTVQFIWRGVTVGLGGFP